MEFRNGMEAAEVHVLIVDAEAAQVHRNGVRAEIEDEITF